MFTVLRDCVNLSTMKGYVKVLHKCEKKEDAFACIDESASYEAHMLGLRKSMAVLKRTSFGSTIDYIGMEGSRKQIAFKVSSKIPEKYKVGDFLTCKEAYGV